MTDFIKANIHINEACQTEKTSKSIDDVSLPHTMNTLHEIGKERYLFEMERKDKVTESISFPLGIVCLIGGTFIFIGDFIIKIGINKLGMIFTLLAICFTLTWLASILSLLPCLFQKYYFVQTPFIWKEYKDNLLTYYISKKEEINDDVIDSDIRNGITRQYIEYAHLNSISNDNKSKWIIKSRLLILTSAIFSATIILFGFFKVSIT
jgi:hypothetical protein